jgi:rRNA maturation endonuclease Nob1
METKSIRGKVVMLTTEKASIIVSTNNNTLYLQALSNKDNNNNYKHLYITSEEEIKKGDWGINLNKDTLYRLSSNDNIGGWKKVIASTDKLEIGREHDDTVPFPKTRPVYLPTLKSTFVDKYIEQYNKDNVIEDVLIEMEQLMVKGSYNNKCSSCGEIFSYSDKLNFICSSCGLRVKTNANNQVTIRKIKDSWNREEVLELLDFVNERLPDYYSKFSCEKELLEWEKSL